MSRYIGPKNKRARQIGEDLGLKSNALKVAKRVGIRPGQHGAKRKKTSDFGVQLKEKQKLKYIYGITEKQLRLVFAQASKDTSATGNALLSLLERRLDTVVYRMGWAPTRAAARQLVAHAHVRVNGKRVSVASYRVNVSDTLSLSDTAMKIPAVSQTIEANPSMPAWLEKKQGAGIIKRLPERADITESIEEQLVVEYYSR